VASIFFYLRSSLNYFFKTAAVAVDIFVVSAAGAAFGSLSG
jgi:hypothetical protein